MHPKIDVYIPFSTDLNIGAEYNRVVSNSKSDWVLILDHDVLLVNPEWYHICQQAIVQHPEAALFTCYCNAYTKHDGNVNQRYDAPGLDAPVLDHRLFARSVFESSKFKCSQFSDNTIGFFMLISKSAWKQVGGFRSDGIFGVDYNYVGKLRRFGLKTMLMEGLYTLHLHYRDGSWINNKKSTKELWEEYIEKRKQKKNQ